MIQKSFCLSIFSFLFLLCCPKKTNAYPDSLQVRSLIAKSVEAFKNDQIDSSGIYAIQSRKISLKNDDLFNFSYAYYALASNWKKKENGHIKALAYYEKISSEKFRNPVSNAEWKLFALASMYQGFIFKSNVGDYKKALNSFEKTEEIYRYQLKTEDLFLARYIYVQLGNINTRLGDYNKALHYLDKVKSITLENKAYDDAGEAYCNIGIVHRSLGAHEKAIDSYTEGLKIKNLGAYATGTLNINLGFELYSIGDYESAVNATNKGLLLLDQTNIRNKEIQKSNVYGSLGLIQHALKNHEVALENFDKALSLATAYYPNPNRREIAKLEIQKGKSLLALRKEEQALGLFQKALQKVLPDFHPKDDFENPEPTMFYAENTIMEGLVAKAEAMEAFARIKKDSRYYEMAFETYELVFQVEKKLNDIFDFNTSKTEVLRESKKRIAKVIDLCYALWIENKDPRWIEKAFQFNEKGKARLLQDAIRENQVLSNMEDSLFQKAQSYEIQLAELEKKRFDIQSKHHSKQDSLLSIVNEDIFKTIDRIKSFKEKLATDYPHQFAWTSMNQVFELKEVQTMLDNDQTLVEYFVEEGTSIYVFVINQNSFDFLKLSDANLIKSHILDLRKGLYGYYMSAHQNDSIYQACNQLLASSAHLIFQKIIQPFEGSLKNKLIIVPDGILAYIPFEVLTRHTVEHFNDFESYPFLLLDHDISYAYSLTLLQQMQQKKINRKKKKMLAIAPDFEDLDLEYKTIAQRRSALGVLKFNTEEVKSIGSLYDADILTGADASEDNFRKIASNYSILHLATHGKANDEIGAFSFIAFTEVEDTIENEFLYNRDLYTLNLSADLVVLSACETGIGQLQKGEGVISMARGFAHAGAKSILTTLWSINDEATSIIMLSFYQGLLNRQSKEEALTNAKRHYLKSNEGIKAHPYYWAGFVAIGDMSVLEIKTGWSWWFYGLSVLGIILASVIFYRSRLS